MNSTFKIFEKENVEMIYPTDKIKQDLSIHNNLSIKDFDKERKFADVQ